MTTPWKVIDLINATRTFFEKKGIVGTARLDAELLLAKVLGCRRIDLYLRYDQPVEDPRLGEFRELVRQRGDRRPVKQILGACEFMSHEFEVTADVLVPRPETETVVEQALSALGDGPRIVVDLGTGSGNIAVSIALARPGASVFAVDISDAALAVAARNVARHALAGRVTLLAGDLFAPLDGHGLEGRADCVVSNPPYVAESELAQLMPEVAQYEPRIALTSGQDGLGHIVRILEGAPRYLRTGGALVCEMSAGTAERANAAAQATGFYSEVRTVADLGKVPRVLVARRG